MSIENIEKVFNLSFLQAQIVMAVIILLLSLLFYFIIKKIFLRIAIKLAKKTENIWDDKLIESKFFHKLIYIVPLLIINSSANFFPSASLIIKRLSGALIVGFTISSISSLLSAVNAIYMTTKNAKNKPIKSYLQILEIFFYIAGGIIGLGILLDKSPWIFISSLGAMTAIIMLIFKDTILSIIAGLQISFNDLIKIGDWISVPQFDTDGEVLDIALHTVKIQNWDKTISVIPIYKLLEGTFKNWRGMQEAGGRRIKRSINIDITSIKFCDKDLLEKLKRINLLREYLRKKENEINQYNEINKFHNSDLVNKKNLTNIGTFRAYIDEYLKNNSNINKNMTFFARQLAPNSQGLPIEIYAFTNDIEWKNYEAIQSDIFDHLLSIIKEFELRVFQYPSSYDLSKAISSYNIEK